MLVSGALLTEPGRCSFDISTLEGMNHFVQVFLKKASQYELNVSVSYLIQTWRTILVERRENDLQFQYKAPYRK